MKESKGLIYAVAVMMCLAWGSLSYAQTTNTETAPAASTTDAGKKVHKKGMHHGKKMHHKTKKDDAAKPATPATPAVPATPPATK